MKSIHIQYTLVMYCICWYNLLERLVLGRYIYSCVYDLFYKQTKLISLLWYHIEICYLITKLLWYHIEISICYILHLFSFAYVYIYYSIYITIHKSFLMCSVSLLVYTLYFIITDVYCIHVYIYLAFICFNYQFWNIYHF